MRSVISVAPMARRYCRLSNEKLNKMEIANLFKKEIFGAFIVNKIPKGIKARILNKTSRRPPDMAKGVRLRLLVFVISRKASG